MRQVTTTAMICLLLVSRAASEEPASKAAEGSPAPPKYQLLRYQEDYSVLGDGPREDWLDSLKYRPLGWDDLRVTVGGQSKIVNLSPETGKVTVPFQTH